MKISEVTKSTVKEFLRIDTSDDDSLIDILIKTAKDYIIGYTGVLEADLDKHEDLTTVLLVLCSDFYDNRQMQVQYTNVNRVVQSILDLHCVNFL